MKSYQRRIYQNFLVGILLLIISVTCFATPSIISNYQPIFVPCQNQNQLYIAIRSYNIESNSYFLLVDPNTLATKTIASSACSQTDVSMDSQAIQNTPYLKALNRFSAPPYKLTNYGITHAEHPVNGIFLTGDLCPSLKPFEEKFFQTLVDEANKNNKPTPIALAVTGIWIINHPMEFKWLVEQEKANKLQIIWINHSYHHVYHANLPAEKNFLLIPNTDFTHEVLNTEKLLLEEGETPSVFFRFPGLVSDKQLIQQLRQFGLIPIGSDAWLAKGQKATSGSIVLVHGNSNEPAGIKLIMPILEKSEFNLLPLNQLF